MQLAAAGEGWAGEFGELGRQAGELRSAGQGAILLTPGASVAANFTSRPRLGPEDAKAMGGEAVS